MPFIVRIYRLYIIWIIVQMNNNKNKKERKVKLVNSVQKKIIIIKMFRIEEEKNIIHSDQLQK